MASTIDARGTDFSFPINKLSKKMRRDLLLLLLAIIAAIQFFDSIFHEFSSSFNNSALLKFFCQLPLRLK